MWEGRAQVLTAEGEDFSAAFLDGARQALALVQRHDIRIAVLKANSPSCGNLLTYDGTFSGVKVSGEGVTAALLKRHGVQVFSELELPEAAPWPALSDLIKNVGGRHAWRHSASPSSHFCDSAFNRPSAFTRCNALSRLALNAGLPFWNGIASSGFSL